MVCPEWVIIQSQIEYKEMKRKVNRFCKFSDWNNLEDNFRSESFLDKFLMMIAIGILLMYWWDGFKRRRGYIWIKLLNQ